MNIPDDWSVISCDLDADSPWCEIIEDSSWSGNATRIEVPKALAYYLSHHYCGSAKMNQNLVNQGRRSVQNDLKRALGIW